MHYPLQGIDHVIIYHNAGLTLLEKKRDGSLAVLQEAATPAIENHYKFYKSIAHIGVWLNIIFQSIINQGVSGTTHKDELLIMKADLSRLQIINDELGENESSVIVLLNQAIDSLISTVKTAEIARLQSVYLVQLIDANKRYAQKAAELQLNGMHSIMSSWMNIHHLNFHAVRVLIVCPHGPKKELIEIQYFSNLYEHYGLSKAKRKGYILPVTMLAEQISTVTQEHLIDFLRKHQLNKFVGQSMLGNPMAMNRDVLGSYAPPVLKKQSCPMHNISDSLKRLSHFAHNPQTQAPEQAQLAGIKSSLG